VAAGTRAGRPPPPPGGRPPRRPRARHATDTRNLAGSAGTTPRHSKRRHIRPANAANKNGGGPQAARPREATPLDAGERSEAELGPHCVLRRLVAGEPVLAARVVEHQAQFRIDVVVETEDPGFGLDVGEITVLDVVETRRQLPQPRPAHLRRPEHPIAGLVDLAAAVEHHTALHVPGLDLLIAARRLAKTGI